MRSSPSGGPGGEACVITSTWSASPRRAIAVKRAARLLTLFSHCPKKFSSFSCSCVFRSREERKGVSHRLGRRPRLGIASFKGLSGYKRDRYLPRRCRCLVSTSYLAIDAILPFCFEYCKIIRLHQNHLCCLLFFVVVCLVFFGVVFLCF